LETRRQTAAPSYYESQKIHLGHFTRFLGPRAELRCSLVNQRLLEEYLLKRLAVRNPATVKREKTTLTHFYRWVAVRSDVPAFPSPVVGLPVFKSSIDRPPFRTIHEMLKAILVDWQCQRPGGQLVISRRHDKLIVPPALANRLFWRPMGKTSWVLNRKRNWFKIGFHSYRHSFASNLAAAGIDQRIIDEFMGHQTDEMRRRYRHLFPQAKRSAIV